MKRSIKRCLIGILFTLCLMFGLTGCELLKLPTNDKTAPRIVFACSESYLAKVGSTFTIPTDEILVMDDVDADVTPTFSVKYGEETVSLNKNKFKVEKSGVYTVTVNAKDSAGNETEKKIEVHTSAENEINSFDDQVRIDQTYTLGYAQTSLNTDEEYIKDGTGSLRFRVLSHEALGWPRLVVDNLPINDIIEYYSISFWAYNDGTSDVEIYLHRNDVSAKAKFKLPAKTWTKVEVVGRNYDTVFKYMEATSWGEPEVGMCEDMKCFTFHIVNPANSPQYDIYVDSLQVNNEKVYDTLEISAKVKHPVVGVEYEMPTVEAMLGNEIVDATVSLAVYDSNYNEIPVTDGKVTLETAGKYTLAVEATYGKITTKKNYMLVCAPTRAENEIEFFEYDTAMNFVRSEHFNLSLSSNEAQSNNGSTKSLKISSSQARWGYLTLGALPYADLEDVSYIWFYAKTDSEIKDTETPYIGIRDGGRNKVLKRMSLTNEWKCFTLTKQQLFDLGVESLNGLQISLELYDTTNPDQEGGWCPVTFTTYVDNFSVGLVSEPTEKEEGVLLDFANDRDLDNLISSYISYNFYDLEKTTNGVGSLKVSAEGKWPEIKLGDGFADVDLTEVKNICIDAYVPSLAENSYVKIGINDKNYQKITTAGEWTTLKYALTVDSLVGMKINSQRVTDGSTVELGTYYIGKIYFEYWEVDPEAETHVKPGNVLYDFYDREEALKIVYGSATGEKVILDDGSRAAKLVKTTGPWDTMTLPSEIDEKFDVAEVNYIYLEVYSQEETESEETRITYYYYTESTSTDEATGETTTTGAWKNTFISFKTNSWTVLRIPVKANTPSLASIKFGFQKKVAGDWEAIGKSSGDALYIREIGVFSDTVAYGDFTGTFETSMDMSIFRVENSDFKILSNENLAYVKEGKKSLSLQGEPRWPIYYFSQLFIDWLNENKIISISFDVYIENTNGNITAVEGILQAKWDQWYTVTVATSSLTTSTKLQVNKTNASTNSYIYIDNMQFEYLDYTDITESATNHSPLFSVKNSDYKMSVNTDTAYVNEGSYSLKFTAVPQWPIYYFTQTFIDWLNENGIVSISFDVYIDNAGSETNVVGVEGGILKAKYDQWYTVTLETSKITTSSKLQVNKSAAKTLSFYIDNLQFVKA